MHLCPAAILDEQLAAPLWQALQAKLSSPGAVFDPTWGIHGLGTRELRAWLQPPSPLPDPDPSAWQHWTARLALLRIDDLRRISTLLSLWRHHDALRRCVEGGAVRALHRHLSAGTLRALHQDPPSRSCAGTPADWRVERLCDEGARHLMASWPARDWTWRLARAAFPRAPASPVLPFAMTPMEDFLDWCSSRLRAEAWWSG